MADIQSQDSLAEVGDALGAASGPPVRPRRRLRIALLSLASMIVLLGAVMGAGFAYVNHAVGSIHRIPVKFLAHENGAWGGMTVLLTSSEVGPTGGPAGVGTGDTGLIMLLHINADHQAGGVVSIPPQTEVNVPGYGQQQLGHVIAIGGPSLLVQTVNELSGVPINHFARIDLDHVDALVNAVGGVTVTVPETTVSFGHVFYTGQNCLDGLTALYYARDPSLAQDGRVLRQQSLMRAVLVKLADDHLLTRPWTMVRVLNALSTMLTVDSNFTNSDLESLATELGHLSSSVGTFVTAPTEVVIGSVVLVPAESRQLWAAISNDSLASFAWRHPGTVTPATVP